MTEREFDAVSRLTAWLRECGKDRSAVWREDLEIVLQMARRLKSTIGAIDDCGDTEHSVVGVCTCHERDSSYACQFCRAQGIRGHMEEMPPLPAGCAKLFNASQVST